MARTTTSPPRLDTGVGALLVRTGHPRWDYGALATARSLGSCGVTVHVLADRNEPELLRSRFVRSVVGPVLDPATPPEAAATRLNQVAERIGRPVLTIAGDDESAVLLAEQRSLLDPRLLTFDMPEDLPRRLSSKSSLAGICRDAGIDYPEAVTTTDADELLAFAERVGFPVIVKAPEPFARLHESDVMRTQVVESAADLTALAARWPAGRPLLAQQYLASERFQFWYAAGLAGASTPAWHAFTGRKEVAYPTGTGIGIYSVAARNPELAAATHDLADSIGFRGPFDSDWAVDTATGQRWLIDFNPRRGAQFRLFTTDTGIDLMRAAHLAITGNPIPWGAPTVPRSHSVGNLDLLVARQWWAAKKSAGDPPNEGAWWWRRDPAPGVAMAASFVAAAGRKALKAGGLIRDRSAHQP
ncbi:MAG: hypothetical protein KDC23_05190 [Actinobacteria bacterium]|nr:hypothetical protein [Actinomycetota bacterium]